MRLKHYLNDLLCACADEKFGQDAIEWAILSGHVKPTYHLKTDVRLIMGSVPDGPPGQTNYDRIILAYRQHLSEQTATLVDSYASSGLLEEILRPVPLAVSQTVVTVSVGQPEPVEA